ncbi:MAG: hypothetical protein ABFE01_15620 [Phycisphaerales bacterium]
MVDESDYRDEADDLDESDDWDESDGPKDGVEKGVAEKLCQINARLDKIAVQSRKVEERARFTGGLLIVMAIGFIWVWSATFGGRIASYPATKQADGSFFYLDRNVYRVYPSTQTVVFWKPGVWETPEKLTNCTVIDRRNWTGWYEGKRVEMRKGKRINVVGGWNDYGTDIVRIGGFHWWFLRAKAHFDHEPEADHTGGVFPQP